MIVVWQLDGLLFYHKRTHYAFGTTPLVLWLKAFMLPEILGVPVSAHHMQQRPASYSTFLHHAEQVRTNTVTRKRAPHGRSRSSDNIDIGAASVPVAMETGSQKSRRRRAKRRHKTKSGSMEVEAVEGDPTVAKTDSSRAGETVSVHGTKSDGDDTEDSMVVTALNPTWYYIWKCKRLCYAHILFIKLKVPHQFDFFARLISNAFCENSNLPSIHYDTLARLWNFYM